MKYFVRHQTQYRYSEPVSSSQHDLHLLPRELPQQHCLSSQLHISPTPTVCAERLDYFGNRTCHMVLSGAHTEFNVRAESTVEVTARAPVQPGQDDAWEAAAKTIATDAQAIEIQEFTFSSPLIVPWEELTDYTRASFPVARPLLEAAVDLMARIHHDFTYDPKATTIATPLPEVFVRRRGVCQDFAQLMIAGLRGLGLAVRYVSGYLVTTPPPGKPRLVGADASHAWLSVYSPRHGFVDLDPTNNVVVDADHITLAIGRDFSDVTPLRGVVLGGGRHELQVGVDVVPEGEAGTA